MTDSAAEPPIDRGKAKDKWCRLRVAGLCISVDKYAHMGNLSNALRDVEAVCKKLKATPGCYAALLSKTSTTSDMLKSVRSHLQEPGLLKPPLSS